MLGAGFYMSPRDLLDRFRRSVVDPEKGQELAAVLEKIKGIDGYELGGKHYKRIPAPYDSSQLNAELLLHNGLYAGYETDIPEEFYSSRIIDYCIEKFYPLAPLHEWFVAMNQTF